MAHSKRNSTAAFFTAHERAELKSTWGSRSTRLTRESFLPFGSCNLCLLPARDPVSCSAQGHLFCRECALSNLLAQSKEIKRLKREAERRKAEDDEEKHLEDAERQAKALQSFEDVQAGLNSDAIASGRKRKADEVPEDELGHGERDTKRREHTAGDSSSFWIPSQRHGEKSRDTKVAKKHPTCPVTSDEHEHDLSLSTMVAVRFHEELSKENSKEKIRSCPSCNKALSNATKAVLAKPCGHVLCKSCSDKFQKKPEKTAHDRDLDEVVRCYVCQESLSATSNEDGEKDKKKHKTQRGLTELRSDGTGFASGGTNMVKRQGVAFQVG